MSGSLQDCRALIVGGSSGIGRAAAEAFAAGGASVIAASRHPGRMESRPSIACVALDMTDAAQVAAFFQSEAPFDHIVVSAAETRIGTLSGLALDEARAAMESKFWGAYLIARSARFTARGSLTLVSGLLSVRPSGGAVLQGAINAALEALGRGLALDLSPVRVNTVSPGFIDTPVHDHMAAGERAVMFEGIARGLPVGRIGRAEEVAQAILMAATNGFVTGATIPVDGGGAIA